MSSPMPVMRVLSARRATIGVGGLVGVELAAKQSVLGLGVEDADADAVAVELEDGANIVEWAPGLVRTALERRA
jgi:hypothetical protein